MIYRFSTFETASIFAMLKREEGYYAEVLHVNVGHLWVPLAMTGFPVLVSEFSAEEGDEPPEALPQEATPFLDELRKIFVYTTLAILAGSLVLGIATIMHENSYNSHESDAVVIIGFLIWLSFLSGFGWILSELTRIYRDPDYRLNGVVRACHIAVAILLLVDYVVPFGVGLIHIVSWCVGILSQHSEMPGVLFR